MFLAIYLINFCYRLAQSESVQYFKFDKDGELFVYEPGVGCLGPYYKVPQGFEINDITQKSLSGSKVDELQHMDVSSSPSALLSQESVTFPNVTEKSGVKRLDLVIYVMFNLLEHVLFDIWCRFLIIVTGRSDLTRSY